jgi:hypothetical protein
MPAGPGIATVARPRQAPPPLVVLLPPPLMLLLLLVLLLLLRPLPLPGRLPFPGRAPPPANPDQTMNSITTSLAVAGCIFTGGVVGLYLHRLLPEHHLTSETQDVVRLGTGMLSVLASLVLGLLIATAKTSYDSTDHAIRSYAAELALLNETLRDYGGTASVPRDVLRRYTTRLLRDGWPTDGTSVALLDDDDAGTLLEHVRETIRALRPVDAGQKSLQDGAIDSSTNLLRQRWLLIEQQGPSVQRVVLGVLVSWITVIFASFGINAPRNGTVVATFLIGSMAIGGAVFLILQMDRPLDGVMQISSEPIRNVMAHMDW